MRRIEGFIGGKSVKATSGREGDVFNPNTGEVQARVSFATTEDVMQPSRRPLRPCRAGAAPTRNAAPA